MKMLFLLFILGGWVWFYFAFVKSNKKSKREKLQVEDFGITAKKLMTKREKVMFAVLLKALPDCFVFSQVCLGAILNAPYQHRGRFAQKMADYVITDKDFNVIAVIELDDASHYTKRDQDFKRDQMVKCGGYKVLRYPNIPKKEQLIEDVLGSA